MMTRTTWTLAFFFVSLLTVHVRAAEADVRDPHVRSIEPEMLDDLERGAASRRPCSVWSIGWRRPTWWCI
jgi:hypothetical protein